MSLNDVNASDAEEPAYLADADVSDAPSLAEDLRTFASDGKTYLQAELAFQKSRASFTAGRAKSSLVYGAGAFAFLHLALIALVLGLVISLATLVGPWLATAIVVAALLIGAVLLALKLKREVTEIGTVFSGEIE